MPKTKQQKKEINLMNIIAIVGNPPYQNNINKNRIYPYFYFCSINIADIIVLIFPDVWQQPKNTNNLSMMNKKEVKEDKQIVFIKNLINVFIGTAGARNVNIIVWKRNFDNNYNGKQLIYNYDGTYLIKKLETDITSIKKPEIIKRIVKKIEEEIIKKEYKSVASIIHHNPYGVKSDIFNNANDFALALNNIKTNNDDIHLYRVKNHHRIDFFVNCNILLKESECFTTYKVFVPQAWGNMSPTSKYLGGSYSEPIIGVPKDCCTVSYIEFGPFLSLEEASAMNTYLHTKFFRIILFNHKHSHNTSRKCYASIPLQDFTSNSDIDWSKTISEIDQQLYKKYGLSDKEITYIEEHIQSME